MNSLRVNKNLLAISVGSQEIGINIYQDSDQSLLVGESDYINPEPRREDNTEEITGKEEADTIYDLGTTASGSLTFDKLQPNQAAILLAYGLGSCSSVVSGSGYVHTITPIGGDVDGERSNPSFTAVQRYGETVAKRRFASNFIDALTMTFAVDDWVKGSGQVKSTGMYESSVIEEAVTAPGNTTTLTLAANGVQGSTAAERLDNVQIVRALVNGGYEFATATAVSADTPAAITIEALSGGVESTEYKIIYVPTEPSWCSFPSRITESPLRTHEMCLWVGGAWNGTAFVGGKKISAPLKSFEYSLSNNLNIEFTFCAGGAYGGRAFRSGRTQTVKLERHLRDMLLQQYLGNNETCGLYVKCTGKEFTTGENYLVELIFPRLGILSSPISSSDKVLAETGDLKVLEDSTYGSVIAKITNQVAQYAQ